ncbi:hypothetical protein [Porticoccus sp.]
MRQALRDWYLGTLGIVQYRPREEDGAELPFHVASPAVAPLEVEPPLARQVPPASDTEQLAQLLQPQQVSLPSPKPSEQVSVEQIPAADQAPFRLACWQPCEDLLVLNALSSGGVPVADETALLGNLLRAIGRGDGGSLTPELIDWPLGKGESSDLAGAKAMLSVFVDVRIRKRGVLAVLLMGELPAALLLPSQRPYPEVLGTVEELAGGARAIVTRSLQEMLREPAGKRDSWLAIQHLSVLP